MGGGCVGVGGLEWDLGRCLGRFACSRHTCAPFFGGSSVATAGKPYHSTRPSDILLVWLLVALRWTVLPPFCSRYFALTTATLRTQLPQVCAVWNLVASVRVGHGGGTGESNADCYAQLITGEISIIPSKVSNTE